MAWATRFGDVVKGVVTMAVDILTIVTELMKQVSTKVDELLDDLKGKPT